VGGDVLVPLAQVTSVTSSRMSRFARPHCGGRVLPERDHVERVVQALHSAFELCGPRSLGQEEPFKAQETRLPRAREAGPG
jgi:hypothetical protein